MKGYEWSLYIAWSSLPLELVSEVELDPKFISYLGMACGGVEESQINGEGNGRSLDMA